MSYIIIKESSHIKVSSTQFNLHVCHFPLHKTDCLCMFSFSGSLKITTLNQCAKKVVSDSPGQVDFAIGLVILVLHFPGGQVLFFFLGNSNYRRIANQKGFRNDLWASTSWLQLAQMAGCKTDFLCTLLKFKYGYMPPSPPPSPHL